MSSFTKLTCKWTFSRCLSKFIDLRYGQSCWCFWPSLQSPSLPFPVHCIHVDTYTGWGGVFGSGPQTEKHLPQSSFTGQFFRWRHFALSSLNLIFLRSGPSMTIRFVNHTIHWHKVLSRDTIMRFFGLEFLHHLSLYRIYMSQWFSLLVFLLSGTSGGCA